MGKEKSKSRSKSADYGSSSSSSESSKEKKKLKKIKKKLKKEQRRTEKAIKKRLKDQKRRLKKQRSESRDSKQEDEAPADIPIELMEKSKTMAPMTKEEWEKRQSVVRKELDKETGRYRLIKGDGEVLEEIVSKDRHKQINKQATQADGEFFQSQIRRK